MSNATEITLTIGTDYRECLGLPASCSCVYLGGNLWRQGMEGKPSREMESPKAVEAVKAHLALKGYGTGLWA